MKAGFWFLVLIFITSTLTHTKQSMDCPSGCRCNKRKVECRGVDITNLPEGIPKNTEVLELHGEDRNHHQDGPSVRKAMNESTFNDFPRLLGLIIRGFSLATLPQGIFYNLKNLRFLDLQNNRLVISHKLFLFL